jgi:protoporphyrinogen oxidase
MKMKNVMIIGGGITGLAAAHRLLEKGYRVTVLEASDRLGGLGTYFRYRNLWIDKFYHCTMPTDSYLHSLMGKVGLKDQLYWKPTTMSFIVNGRRYAFNTPADLLRFDPLSYFERIKLGAVSLLLRRLGEGKDLDNIPTQEWLTQLFGRNIWESFWGPLFRSKFGPLAGKLPALYLWQRLGRERNVSTRGYLKCGYKGLIDALQQSIESKGGNIQLNSPVEKLRESENGIALFLQYGEVLLTDWVISTVPLPLLRQMTRGSSFEKQYNDPGLSYQGVVNVLFFLSRPLDGHYWTPVVNSRTDFDGVVEMSALVDKNQYGNSHLVYLMKYCDRKSELFSTSEEDIIKRWKKQFLRLYQDLPLTENDVLDARVFKAPFVEPVYPLGYSTKKPPFQVGNSRLILATTTQVYPQITSWNFSVRLAYEAVAHLTSQRRNSRAFYEEVAV